MKIKPLHFVFFGALISLLGTFFPSLHFWALDTKIPFNPVSFLGAMIAAVSLLFHNIASSSKTSSILDNTVLHLNRIEEVLKNYTGGESFPVFTFMLTPTILHLAVICKGDYPLQDLKIRIYDVGKAEIERKKGNTHKDFTVFSTEFNTHLNVDYLQPGLLTTLLYERPSDLADNFNLKIFVFSRNGQTIQELVGMINEDCVYFESITVTRGEEVLYWPNEGLPY